MLKLNHENAAKSISLTTDFLPVFYPFKPQLCNSLSYMEVKQSLTRDLLFNSLKESRLTPLFVFFTKPKVIKKKFGYPCHKLSETTTPGTFCIKAAVMVILSPLMDN